MRIYTSENEPLDWCRDCAPGETEAREYYANLGDGPDGCGNCFSYDSDHPVYSGDWYFCAGCGRELTDDD